MRKKKTTSYQRGFSRFKFGKGMELKSKEEGVKWLKEQHNFVCN